MMYCTLVLFLLSLSFQVEEFGKEATSKEALLPGSEQIKPALYTCSFFSSVPSGGEVQEGGPHSGALPPVDAGADLPVAHTAHLQH